MFGLRKTNNGIVFFVKDVEQHTIKFCMLFFIVYVCILTDGNMKSAVLNEQNYQFKTKVNMKTKISILSLTKAFFILLVSGRFLLNFKNNQNGN